MASKVNFLNDISEMLSPYSYLARNNRGSNKFLKANKNSKFAKLTNKLWFNRWLKFSNMTQKTLNEWQTYYRQLDEKCQNIIDELERIEENENSHCEPKCITSSEGIKLSTLNVSPYEFIKQYYNILYLDVRREKPDLKFRNTCGAEMISFLDNIDYEGGYQVAHSGVEKGDVVIDVGGGYGFFALLALKQGASKVHVFEPNEEARKIIIRNRYLNGYTKEEMPIYKYALGDNEHTALLYTKSKTHCTGIIEEIDPDNQIRAKHKNVVSVEVTTLDAFFRRLEAEEKKKADRENRAFKRPIVDFIKISTNGNEQNVLKGGSYFFGYGTEQSKLPDIVVTISATYNTYQKVQDVIDKIANNYSHNLRVAKLHSVNGDYEFGNI